MNSLIPFQRYNLEGSEIYIPLDKKTPRSKNVLVYDPLLCMSHLTNQWPQTKLSFHFFTSLSNSFKAFMDRHFHVVILKLYTGKEISFDQLEALVTTDPSILFLVYLETFQDQEFTSFSSMMDNEYSNLFYCSLNPNTMLDIIEYYQDMEMIQSNGTSCSDNFVKINTN